MSIDQALKYIIRWASPRRRAPPASWPLGEANQSALAARLPNQGNVHRDQVGGAQSYEPAADTANLPWPPGSSAVHRSRFFALPFAVPRASRWIVDCAL